MPGLSEARLHLAIEIFDAVGRLQTPAKPVKETRSVQRQGLFEALLKGSSCIPIDLPKFDPELQRSAFLQLLRSARGRKFCAVGPSELLAPYTLIGLREVTDNVFPFVPLAALHLHT